MQVNDLAKWIDELQGNISVIKQQLAALSGSVSDVPEFDIDTPEDGQALVYDATGAAWKNASVSANDNIYSTTETEIGTWIDGRPVYRKVFDLSSTPLTAGTIDVTALDIGVLIYLDAYGSNSDSDYSGTGKWTINGVTSNSSRIIYMTDKNTIKFEGNYYKYYVVVEYTKTNTNTRRKKQ